MSESGLCVLVASDMVIPLAWLGLRTGPIQACGSVVLFFYACSANLHELRGRWFLPAAAWYFLLFIYLVFALVERKYQIQKKNRTALSKAACGRNAGHRVTC